ncbi:hypothetical protein FRB90_008540 [Tulasnella sp. 427]|nr:hypothetical protein FRB90_008540 [Tulasnella sp. 427]
MGKEKLAGPPAAHDKPATGITATLASTGLAALDATHRGITMAHQTLHDKAGPFPHSHTNEPAHPVTVPSKPLGEALQDNVAAAQSAAQPHIDNAKATAQPHIDNAKATAQPHIDRAAAAAQPHIDAAKPYVASAQDAAKPYVDAGAAQVNTAATGLQQQVAAVQGKIEEMRASDKPVSTQLSEAASSAATTGQQALSNAATQVQGTLNAKTEPAGTTIVPDTTTELPKATYAPATAPVPEVAKDDTTKTL